MSTWNYFDNKLFLNTDPTLSNIFLFGNASFKRARNTQILNATIEYIPQTQDFLIKVLFNDFID